MTPSKYQKDIYEVFTTSDSNINISAVAGSGKTTVLLELLKFVPDDKQALFVAFNNSIVDELKERIGAKSNVEISTIHSYGWRSVLCRYGSKVKMNPNKVFGKIEGVLKQYEEISAKKHSYYFYIIPKIIDLMRCNLTPVDKQEILDMSMHYDLDISEIEAEIAMKVFDKMNHDKSQFDFMDMIYQPVVDAHIRLRKYDYVFCDESQDFSICQQKIIQMSLNRKCRLITVGDVHQCQPIGTKVKLAGNITKDISQLKVGDKVVSYDKTSGTFTGFSDNWSSLKFAKTIEQISKRKYVGDLICVEVENQLSKYTPNHRCIVKFDEEKYHTGYFVYLMNRVTDYGIDWRIGKTRIFNKQGGSFGVRIRLMNECGDNVWILKYCKNDSEAKIWEEIYATKYGITQKCFTTGGNDNKTFGEDKNLKFVFAAVRKSVNKRIQDLFKDLKLDITLPFLTKNDKHQHFSKLHLFECYACNVHRISDALNVMYFENGKKIWKNFNSYLEKYNGDVYSLKIQDTELYVSDNILTHNSIYGFAGADADSYQKLSELNGESIKMPLSVCYRCSRSVVIEAQKIVPEIQYAPDAEMGCVREGSMREDLEQGDWILCRNLKPLVQTYLWLMKNKIKSKIKGKDIGEGILGMINKTGAKTLRGMWTMLELEKEKLFKKLKKRGVRHPSLHPKMELFNQRIEVIECLMNEVTDVLSLKKLIENIFTDEVKGIMLSTIHKSKGLENNRILFLCPELIPSRYATTDWMFEQERNLYYVAVTRAKHSLIYVMGCEFKKDLDSIITI